MSRESRTAIIVDALVWRMVTGNTTTTTKRGKLITSQRGQHLPAGYNKDEFDEALVKGLRRGGATDSEATRRV